MDLAIGNNYEQNNDSSVVATATLNVCTKIKQTSKVNRMFPAEFINFIANLKALKEISLASD